MAIICLHLTQIDCDIQLTINLCEMKIYFIHKNNCYHETNVFYHDILNKTNVLNKLLIEFQIDFSKIFL